MSSYQQHLRNKLFCSICPFPLPFIEYVVFRLYYPFPWGNSFPLNCLHSTDHKSGNKHETTGKKKEKKQGYQHLRKSRLRPVMFRGASEPGYPVSVSPWGGCEVGLRGCVVSCSFEAEMLVMAYSLRSVRFGVGRLIILEAVGVRCFGLGLVIFFKWLIIDCFVLAL